MNKEEKEIVRQAYEKGWSSPRMVDYCTKQADILVLLSDGNLFVIDKEYMEKDFCFGYHDSATDTESYDSANKKASYASKSEDYFREKNLINLKGRLENLNDKTLVPIVVKMYDMHPDCNLVGLQYIRQWEKKDGDIELAEVDRQAIIKGYEQAIEHMNKRIDTYLKKYGLTKVHTWTFWKDA